MLRFLFFSLLFTMVTGLFPMEKTAYVVDQIQEDTLVLEMLTEEVLEPKPPLILELKHASDRFSEGDVIQVLAGETYILHVYKLPFLTEKRREKMKSLFDKL